MDNSRSSVDNSSSPPASSGGATLSPDVRAAANEERLANANNSNHHSGKDPQLRTTSFNLHHHHRQSSGELRSPPGPAAQMNGSRRPQTLVSPTGDQLLFPPKTLKLTIHKDENGYGMKVSGDKPVFVESVKLNGAAHKAGLVASDMILEVNGNPVRYSTHTDVVKWIKASEIVELTVQRGQKMQRPTSISAGVSPSTPLAQRGGITAPLPVDQDKRREMEYSKIHTLRLMLAQEKKTRDALNASNASHKEDILKSDAKIKKLQEQLKQVCGEDMSQSFAPMPTRTSHANSFQSPPATNPAQQSTPAAFLSLFPRSLSSLSLGTRKKDKEAEAAAHQALNNSAKNSHASAFSPPTTGGGKKNSASGGNSSSNRHSHSMLSPDIPPPLPQRNPPRKSLDVNSNPFEIFRNTPISDLDHSGSGVITSPNNNSNSSLGDNQKQGKTKSPTTVSNSNDNGSGKKSKRSKNKTKALSDPKMSSQMFIQMEQQQGSPPHLAHGDLAGKPPPLPPRQYLLDENRLNNNLSNGTNNNNNNNGRALPNSIDTLFNYPLVSQCTPVRDNLSPFPFTHRPNIVQKLQESQAANSGGGSAGGGGGGKKGSSSQAQKSHHDNPVLSTSTHISANKSTAFGLTPQQMQQIGNSAGHKQHRRNISSPEQVVQSIREEAEKHDSNMNRAMTRSAWEDRRSIEADRTPPGTPPPPYRGDLSGAGGDSVTDNSAVGLGSPTARVGPQRPIISMEDDDGSDQETFIDEHGPFRSLTQLLEQENTVYLTVFLNYVLSNSNPTPLLFFLITRIYRDGTAKDMRKWAYEIHSTFLVPGAPLLLPNVDESIAHEVDEVLIKEFDKGEFMRKIFWKSRHKAKEAINVQLQEFQTTRVAGLATMFGPSDQQLQEAKGDKAKEQRIVEENLIPKLVQMVEELETANSECPKKQALCSALSTVLHRIFVTRSNQSNSPMDKVHHFVSREKSFKSRLMGKNRKEQVLGHSLVLRQYYEVTHCNHCQNIIWGVSPQGYHCTNCELNIHRNCVRVLEENCPGPMQQKRKDQHSDNKITKLMEKIRPNHHAQAERSRRLEEEGRLDDAFCSERPFSNITRQPSDRRPAGNASGPALTTQGSVSATDNGGAGMHHQGSFSSPKNGGSAAGAGSKATALPSTVTDALAAQGLDINTSFLEGEKQHQQQQQSSKSAPVSVNRSESYKETLTHARSRNRRKTSDPSLSKTSDDQNLVLGLKNAAFPTSSHSSLSSTNSLDNTPSSSLEAVAASTGNNASIAPIDWDDSDEECDEDWASQIPAEVLQMLSDAEKKRQEIINEIYITERNHTRTLRTLHDTFMTSLHNENLLVDSLQLLFPPALIELTKQHRVFEVQLKQRRKESNHVVGEIGDLLLAMFDGRSGENLKQLAAQFCARQRIALEALKDRRRKDENLQRVLAKAEADKSCRRLQLKDLLPTGLQRLTKYPLLFENLLKVTVRVAPEKVDEADAIRLALKSSRDILNHVNQAVKEAEDTHKLQSIQRKLDRSMFDREPGNAEFKNIDLTKHKLVHSGLLILKKNPTVQFQGLLFEDLMVLLQKQDDKYIIKSYNNPGAGPGENKSLFFPVIKMTAIIVRPSAVDRQTFFVINTGHSQMLELTAPSANECKAWLKHIPETSDALRSRNRSGGQEAGNPPPYSEDHPSGPGVTSKDSFESVGSAGTPDADMMHTSDLVNIKLKKDREGKHRSHGASSNSSPAGRHHAKHSHQSAAEPHHRHATAAGANPAKQFKRKAGPLPPTPVESGEAQTNSGGHRDDVMGPEHEYEDIPDQSEEDEDEEEEERKEDRWNDTGDESSSRNVEDRDELDDDQRRRRNNSSSNRSSRRTTDEDGTNNSNETRTLTQQCSLVAPNAVQITESPALIAEPVLSESEKLRRIDELITSKLAEKQQIICNMFRVPMEDFNTIVDIASQPEAPQEPSDLTLAAFSQIQSLIATLNEHIRISPHAEICAVAAAASGKESQPMPGLSLCDDCHQAGGDAAAMTSANMKAQQQQQRAKQQIVLHEDEDGYCELVEITGRDRRRRSSSINQATAQNGDGEQERKERKESPEEAEATVVVEEEEKKKKEERDQQQREEEAEVEQRQRLLSGSEDYFTSAMKLKEELLTSTQTVPLSLIASNLLALNQTITKLLCKQPERDQEREQLRRELQLTKNHFSSLHLGDVPDNVSEIEEALCVKKVAYVCGDEQAEGVTDNGVTEANVAGDVIDGIIPNLDLSVVEETKEETDSSAVTEKDSALAEEVPLVVMDVQEEKKEKEEEMEEQPLTT